MSNELLGGRFRVLNERLGHGSFGDIYKTVDIQTGESFAAKIEDSSCKYPQLHLEYKVYRSMAKYNGFPRVYWRGKPTLILGSNNTPKSYNVMIMDLLGPSLEKLYTSCSRRFDIKTVCMIGIQLINRIECLHSEGFLHRDIKPDNFLIGSDDRSSKDGSVIHMIDLGLTKLYRPHGKHIPFQDGKRLTGTPRYASVNTHKGIEQSRRDDCESMCYLLIYLLLGRLPWQGLKGSNNVKKYQNIQNAKISITPEELCKDLAPEFAELLTHSRELKFEEEPNYRYMKKLMQLCCKREAHKIDWRFSWQKKSSIHSADEDNSSPDFHVREISSKKRSRTDCANDDYASITCVNQEVRHSKRRRTHGPDDSSSELKSRNWDLCITEDPGRRTSPNLKSDVMDKCRDSGASPISEPTSEDVAGMDSKGTCSHGMTETNSLYSQLFKMQKDLYAYKDKCRDYEMSTLKLRQELREAKQEIKMLRHRKKAYYSS